jgi:hypothetical protein
MTRAGIMARRPTQAERRRNTILGWWGAIALLVVTAWQAGRPELWILPLLSWAYYELCAVPTLCGVETSRGWPCKHPANGRLMACTREPSHNVYKTDALLRMLGFRRNPRQVTASAPRPGREPAAHYSEAPPERVTVESKQTLITALTIIATIAGVIQTVLAATN